MLFTLVLSGSSSASGKVLCPSGLFAPMDEAEGSGGRVGQFFMLSGIVVLGAALFRAP